MTHLKMGADKSFYGYGYIHSAVAPQAAVLHTASRDVSVEAEHTTKQSMSVPDIVVCLEELKYYLIRSMPRTFGDEDIYDSSFIILALTAR